MILLQPPIEPAAVEPLAVVVAGAANGQAAAIEAVEAVSGRLLACLDWDEAVAGVGRPGCSTLLIEAEGVGADLLAAQLPRLDAAAATLGVPVIVTLDEGAIDLVAASMTASSTQLLCAPTPLDRVVALAVTAKERGVALFPDTVREGEAARLQKLNEEVARIADVLSRLTRRGPEAGLTLAAVAEHPSPFRHQEKPDEIAIDPVEVRRAIRARRMRDQHFGGGLFEDPAWDIILDLFASELERAQVSVSSLCIAAAVAPTTALRWIARLTEAGLLERHPDPFDRRRAFMELSPRAGRSMRDYVAALRRAGLPLG